MSDWATEMFGSDALRNDDIAVAGSGKDGDFDAYKTPNSRRNTLHCGIIPLNGDDRARRQLIAEQESLGSVVSPSQGDVGFSSQLTAHELGVFEAKASQKTPEVYGVQCPAEWMEMDPFSQASEVHSSSLAHSGSFGYEFLSQLSTSLVQQEDGGNSHPSGDTIAWSEVDCVFDFWKDPHKFGSRDDDIVSQHMLQFNQVKDNSRYGSGTAASSYNFSSGKTPVRFPGGPASRTSSSRHTNKRDRHLGRTLATSSDDVGTFSSSFQSSDLEMTNTSQDEANSRAFMGKRKRADGEPQTILEGIFIVTRRPNNGEIRRIADFIDWEFQDVNVWFENRARWEASHTSSTKSQNSYVPSTSSTVNILPRDLEDSGFFELPDKPTGARRPKKRLKCHTTSVRKKIEDGNDQEDIMDAKTYPCIHKTCSHSFIKPGEWKRHIASVHYQDRWACLLEEKGQSLPIDGKCSSCEASFDSMRDLKEHMHLSTGCQDTEFVWVFDRKDKLGTHWKKCHEFESGSSRLGDEHLCEREITDFDRKCGFCNMTFTNWDNKIDHVGAHFKDEGRKMSTWRYEQRDDRRSSLERLLKEGQALPGDLAVDSDSENVDSDDSDDSDDDDMEDRPKISANNRRNGRDPDRDGNSGSGNTFPPPPDDSHSGSGGSSSQNYKDNAFYENSYHTQNDAFYARGGEVEAGDKFLTAATSKLHLEPLFSSKTVPAYENIGSLGRGGFGSVDEIRIESTNQVIARKRIHLFPDHARNFTVELEMIQKLRDLDHPHIVRFLGSYVTDTHIDVLMSPVADYDLNEFMLQQHPPVPIAVKTQIAGFYGCLVSALNYIHERDIRHRDIKPKNILVANGNVLIADFGSAIDTHHEVKNKSIGITPKYAAPEVFSSGRHRCASDIWSLGCVFVELATIIHDKTLFELEIFRSSNAKFKKAQPFHKTVRKLHEWMNTLSQIRTTPSQTWQGVSYLDTISKMLQDDEIERPSATELLLRFSPSRCCSRAMNGVESSLPSIPSGLTDVGGKDRLSLAISESLKENLDDMAVAGVISFWQSFINCLTLTHVISFEVAKHLSTERSGYQNIISETKKTNMLQSKSGLLGMYLREISFGTNIKLEGLCAPEQVASPGWFFSMLRLNSDEVRRNILKILVESGGFENPLRVLRPNLTSKEQVSIKRRGFVQLNRNTSQNIPAKTGTLEVTSPLRNDIAKSENRIIAYDGHELLLDPESRWIRVFDLQPMLSGDLDEPISGQLRLVSLDDESLYTALSYAWGNPSPLRQIACSTDSRIAMTKLCVTTSCHDALRQMRHRFRTRTLWTGAICIDQANQREKLHQISLMRDIYDQAKSTGIYLSADHLQPDNAMDWRADTLLDFLSTGALFRSRHYTADEDTFLQCNSLYGQIDLPNNGMHYWKRQWVIQDIGLSGMVRQIQNWMQTEGHDPISRRVNVQLENLSISTWEWIKNKTEEMHVSFMDLTRKNNGSYRKKCKHKDDEIDHFKIFFKGKRCYLAFVGSSWHDIHNLDLQLIGHVNVWDERSPSPGERDWLYALPYGSDFDICYMKPHTNYGSALYVKSTKDFFLCFVCFIDSMDLGFVGQGSNVVLLLVSFNIH